LSRAGSSAHNIWLHIAAESGIPALLALIAMFVLSWRRAFLASIATNSPFLAAAFAWSALSIPWIAAYLLTDAALLDERMLLIFGTLMSLIHGNES
jgi:O-antigen ligase